MQEQRPAFVYILECSDGSLYTGTTLDLKRRLTEHQEDGKKTARYTRGRLPVKLVYSETCTNLSRAYSRERAIKKLRRPEKLELVSLSPRAF